MKDSIYGWGIGWGIILGLVILVVIIYTIIVLRKQVKAKERSKSKPPRELLKEQFARGEISKEEYEARKKNLK